MHPSIGYFGGFAGVGRPRTLPKHHSLQGIGFPFFISILTGGILYLTHIIYTDLSINIINNGILLFGEN
jgi:hypothetical protein